MKRNTLLIFIAVVTFLMMTFWLYYIHEKATFAEKNAVENYELDKIVHVIGGIFIIAVSAFLKGKLSLRSAISSLIVVALVWEIGELVFDPEVSRSFYTSFTRWRADAIVDVVACIAGGTGFYWFLRPRLHSREESDQSYPRQPIQ